MAATDSAAADEFAALQRSQISHLSHHPSDSNSDDSDDSNTHKPSYRQTKPSLRFGNSRQKNVARDEEDYDDDDDDDDWDARYGGTSVFGKKEKGYEIPKGETGRVEGNTGPKGVIADARAAEREKMEEEVVNRRIREGGNRKVVENRSDEEVGRKWFEDESGDEDDDEDGDESFMKEWRRKRMGEVEALARNGNGDAGRGGKGIVEAVDAMGYLEAVDGAAKAQVVVVYISDSESSISAAYLSYLQTLASKYTNTRFISLDFEEAEFEYAGVPALLAYRDGEKFAGLVPLRDEVPFTCNVVTNLEEALKRYNVL